MTSTSVRSACDRLLSGIDATSKMLTYASVPIADYFRQRDINLLKDQLSLLSSVLVRLREKDYLFPEEIRAGLVSLLDECDRLRERCQKLLDREQGTFRLSAATDHRCSWDYPKRNEAFLLRNQIIQHRSSFQAALCAANLVTLAASSRHITARKLGAEFDKQVVAIRAACQPVLAEVITGPIGVPKSRVVLRMRNDVIMPTDVGITTPSRELINFLDDLLGFAAGVLETMEGAILKQHLRGKVWIL